MVLRTTYTVPLHLDAKQALAWLVQLRDTIQYPATILMGHDFLGRTEEDTISKLHDDVDNVDELDQLIEGWVEGLDIPIEGPDDVENKGEN